MWWSQLFWKLFALNSGLLLALVATLSVLLARLNQDSAARAAHARLSGVVAVAHKQLEHDLAAGNVDVLRAKVDTLAKQGGVRVTLVAEDGLVLADSVESPTAMENHRSRPDIVAAREQGSGASTRRSPTLGRTMQYYSFAIRRNDEIIGFLRASVNEAVVGTAGAWRQAALWTLGLLTLAAVGWASHRRAKSIETDLRRLADGSRAMAKGDFELPIAIRNGDAFEKLAETLSESRAAIAGRLAALEDDNETMSTVLGGMVEGVLAVDSKRNVLLANATSLSLLNLTDPVEGRPLLEVVRNVEIDAVVTDAMSAESTCEREISLPGLPRRTLNVLATQLPSATKPGVVVVLHDVTALRRLENMRRDFVTNVSHELKTPLASIKAYSETLRMGAIHDTEHNVGFVERICSEAERLHQLIADIMRLARVEAGDETFEMAAVDLGATIKRNVSQHRSFADQKGVTLITEPPPGAADVWADMNGIDTILTNLLSNAVRYTPTGGQVTVRWYSQDEESVIEVQDTGIGIAIEDQERVFERFFRVDKARSREVGGSGIGLAIVKHLAQSFGGSVGLESEVEQGSNFRVHLPRPK